MKHLFKYILSGLFALSFLIISSQLLADTTVGLDALDDDESDDEASDDEASDDEASDDDDAITTDESTDDFDTKDFDNQKADEEDEENEADEERLLFGSDNEYITIDDNTANQKELSGQKEIAKPITGTWTKTAWFSTQDGSFKFQPRGWIQPQYLLAINPEDENPTAGSGFALKRARVGFQAHLFNFAKIHIDTDFSKGSGSLVDYFIDLDPFEGKVALRFGYFRPWFGRQLLMSTCELQMIDYAKAWTDSKLGMELGRDLGAGIFGMVGNIVEYSMGAWNGEKDKMDTAGGQEVGNKTVPGNIDYMIGGRLAIHPLGRTKFGASLPLKGNSNGDVYSKPALSIGLGTMFNKRHDRATITLDPTSLYYDNQLKMGADLAFKMKGFSFTGEFFMMKIWVNNDADQLIKNDIDNAKIVTDPSRSDYGVLISGTGIGAYAQAGYFITQKKLEVAARFDMVDENISIKGMRFHPAFGATYYLYENNLKAQFMYRLNTRKDYDDIDSGYIPLSHDILFMLQASI